jgi:hypothetical protein
LLFSGLGAVTGKGNQLVSFMHLPVKGIIPYIDFNLPV